MSIEKPYQPSPEEIKKAEEMMTVEQKEKSEEREFGQSIEDMIKRNSCPANSLVGRLLGEVSHKYGLLEKDMYEGFENDIKKIVDYFYDKFGMTRDAECEKDISRELEKFTIGKKVLNEKILDTALAIKNNEKFSNFIKQQLDSIELFCKEIDDEDIKRICNNMVGDIYGYYNDDKQYGWGLRWIIAKKEIEEKNRIRK